MDDGRKFLQDFNNGSEERTPLSIGGPGYVVDSKPDLQVAHIIPGLYLGSQDPAMDEKLLLSHRITHVLSIGIEIDASQNSLIIYHSVAAYDLPEFDITAIFEHCFTFIDSVLETEGSVFVHCNAGISRSPSLVIGYLMKERGFSFEAAYSLVKEVRPSISPNPGFIRQLKFYENWLSSV